jgi:hypothetical protein
MYILGMSKGICFDTNKRRSCLVVSGASN